MVERSVYLLRGAAPGIDRRSAKFTIQNGRLPEQPTMKKTQQKKKISFRLERPFISQTGIDRTPTSSRSSISLVIFSQILAKRLFLHILANPGGQKPNGARETAVTDFGNALRRTDLAVAACMRFSIVFHTCAGGNQEGDRFHFCFLSGLYSRPVYPHSFSRLRNEVVKCHL